MKTPTKTAASRRPPTTGGGNGGGAEPLSIPGATLTGGAWEGKEITGTFRLPYSADNAIALHGMTGKAFTLTAAPQAARRGAPKPAATTARTAKASREPAHA